MLCLLQWSALLPVVLTLVATQQKDTIFADFCYTQWALEAFVIANAQKYGLSPYEFIFLTGHIATFVTTIFVCLLVAVAATPECG
jgi:hypothetical protein